MYVLSFTIMGGANLLILLLSRATNIDMFRWLEYKVAHPLALMCACSLFSLGTQSDIIGIDWPIVGFIGYIMGFMFYIAMNSGVLFGIAYFCGYVTWTVYLINGEPGRFWLSIISITKGLIQEAI